MKRREFIRSVSAIPILASVPIESWNYFFEKYSEAELIGKGNPELYGKGYRLRQKAAVAFEAMKKEAAKKDIHIQVVSSYRSFAHQNKIWERKYNNFTSSGLTPEAAIQKIISYSTIPGTSRHHWATDIDIIDANATQPKNVLLPQNFAENGAYQQLKEWTDKNAEKFGFFLVYTNQKDRKGFNYEPWHFSFADISVPMLEAYQKLDIEQRLKEEKLLGSKYFTSEFIQKYLNQNILDINPQLIPSTR